MLKIAQKIKNGECPVLCFFGDSITDGQFEFANGHKESVRHEEWVFWNILRNRIREEIGQEVSYYFQIELFKFNLKGIAFRRCRLCDFRNKKSHNPVSY